MHSAETCDAGRLQDYGAHAVSLERDMAHEVFYFTVAANKDAKVHPAQLRWASNSCDINSADPGLLAHR